MEECASPHQPWGQADDKSSDVLAAHVARAQPWQGGEDLAKIAKDAGVT